MKSNFCNKCGCKLNNDDVFCPNCGIELNNTFNIENGTIEEKPNNKYNIKNVKILKVTPKKGFGGCVFGTLILGLIHPIIGIIFFVLWNLTNFETTTFQVIYNDGTIKVEEYKSSIKIAQDYMLLVDNGR